MGLHLSRIETGMIINADVSGQGDLWVKGCLEGKVDLPENTLTIEKGGYLEGQVQVKNAIISGEFRGKLDATGKITVSPTGVIHGEVATMAMEVQDGGQIEGTYSIKGNS